MSNFAALRTTVFLLSTNKLQGVISPPSVRGLSYVLNMLFQTHVFFSAGNRVKAYAVLNGSFARYPLLEISNGRHPLFTNAHKDSTRAAEQSIALWCRHWCNLRSYVFVAALIDRGRKSLKWKLVRVDGLSTQQPAWCDKWRAARPWCWHLTWQHNETALLYWNRQPHFCIHFSNKQQISLHCSRVVRIWIWKIKISI